MKLLCRRHKNNFIFTYCLASDAVTHSRKFCPSDKVAFAIVFQLADYLSHLSIFSVVADSATTLSPHF